MWGDVGRYGEMWGDVGRREEHGLEARLRSGPPRAMARARCVRRRAQWRARGMRMACACAQRVRNVCVACAWRVHLGPRRTSPGRKAVAASAESSTRVPVGRGGAAAAGGGEVGGGQRGRGAAPRAVSAASVSRVRVQVRAPGEARASAVWRWPPRGSRGAKWGPRFSRAGTLVRSLTAAQRQHLVRLGRLGLWAQARLRHGR